MCRTEELPLRLIEAPEKVCALAQSPAGIVRMVCDVGGAFLESLEATVRPVS